MSWFNQLFPGMTPQVAEKAIAEGVGIFTRGSARGLSEIPPDVFENLGRSMGQAAGAGLGAATEEVSRQGVGGTLRGFFKGAGPELQTALKEVGEYMGPNGAGRRDISQAVSAIPGVFKDSGLRGMTMMFAAMPVAVVAGKKAVDVGGAYIKRIVAPEAFDVLGKGFYTKINPKSLAHASFEDVIGHADAKAELLRFLEQAQTPKLNAALNKANPRRMMNNVLLAGPPGTGKTELARALASELNKGSKTTFFNVDVEKLLQLEPGTGARNVGQLRKAIQKSRSDKVILFMDEIDGLTSRSMAGANPETNKTITAILKLIDGVEPIKGKEILVVGASNHPRVMDEALINRFRRVIKVGAPNRDELTEMYQLYARKKALVPSGEIDWHAVADHSGQYTGRTVEQAMQTLQERLLSGMPKEELKRIEKSLGKNGKVRKNPVQLSFTQEQLLEAVKAVQKPRYQGDYALIA